MFEQTSMELFYIFHVYVGLTLSKLSLSFFFFFPRDKEGTVLESRKVLFTPMAQFGNHYFLVLLLFPIHLLANL